MIKPSGILIAFTGRRNVGKSTAVRRLEKQGFLQVHAFTGGKAAVEAYFRYILAGTRFSGSVYRMVYGDLKDVPCPCLPNGESPRYFMERFGEFMGVQMGVDWTLKAEVERARRVHGNDVNIAVDSMVYESEYWKELGGKIVRLSRTPWAGQPIVESDLAQSGVQEDYRQFADTPEDVEKNIDNLLQEILTDLNVSR